MNKKQKQLLLGGSLGLIFVLFVGYAAFSSNLTINGTANITSSWNVHIKSITPQTPVGSATSNSAIVNSDGLSATFNTSLVSPGDSITYKVVVENTGSLKAELSDISFTQESTNAITHTYSAISTGDKINPNGGLDEFDVTVTYNPSVTNEPALADKTNELTMILTYNQSK